MSNKNSFLLLLSLALFITFCIEFSSAGGNTVGANGVAHLADQNEQNDFSQAMTWIRDLRSYNQEKRESAKKAIITFSEKSLESRQYVIKKLLEIVNVSDGSIELKKSPPQFLEWKEAADILGIIRATEALDVLINCLDCNDGASELGPGRYPATLAVIKIGNDAIPKLAEALKQKRSGVKFQAAQALYAIGGNKAKDVLEMAMREERDKQMAAIFRDILRNWNSSGRK